LRKIKARGSNYNISERALKLNCLYENCDSRFHRQKQIYIKLDCQMQTPTFFEESRVGCLALRKHRLDVNAHLATRRVAAADDAEAQTLLAGAFAELDAEDGEGGVLHRPGQRAELGLRLLLGHLRHQRRWHYCAQPVMPQIVWVLQTDNIYKIDLKKGGKFTFDVFFMTYE
jgi:hypothetical protein